MRMLAGGFTKDGDKFKAATDAAWWGKPYAHALWAPLGTYLDYTSKMTTGDVNFDEGVANAEPGALSQAIIAIADETNQIRKLGGIGCAMFFIPARRGVMPMPNAGCSVKRKPIVDLSPITDGVRKQKQAVKTVGVVVLAVLALFLFRRR